VLREVSVAHLAGLQRDSPGRMALGSAAGLRIATRGSALAMAQARLIAQALPVPTEIVPITTRGDRAREPLTDIGGKGLFTVELEAALRDGRVSLAVHSAKDLPAIMPEDLVIAATPPREDARDALVSGIGFGLEGVPAAGRIGTSSGRRACQVKSIRPDVIVEPIRGNVETRLAKLRGGGFDAVVVAMAGLKRLGLLEELGNMVVPLDTEDFVPAAGQGVLAVQCLAGDVATRAILSAMNDGDTAAALAAERSVVRSLGATCRSAVGVYVRRGEGNWLASGMVAVSTGTAMIRAAGAGSLASGAAEALLARLRSFGAEDILNRGRC